MYYDEDEDTGDTRDLMRRIRRRIFEEERGHWSADLVRSRRARVRGRDVSLDDVRHRFATSVREVEGLIGDLAAGRCR